MKKFITLTLSFITALTLTSCSKKINNEFFSEDTLKKYALSSDFPNPNAKTTSLMSSTNLYVNLSEDEYKSYAENVYEYLSKNDYFYVGTYKQQGLIAEMLPRYVYEEIDDQYDFSSEKHKFTYSTTNNLSSMSDGHSTIDPCYIVTIERVQDTKYSVFASETYNTIIRLGEETVYVEDALVEKHQLKIKDLNDIILNKDELCEPNESYGLFKAGEKVRFNISFLSGLSATLYIDGRTYEPKYPEAWKMGYIDYTMPEYDVSVVSLVNNYAGDEVKLSETIRWGSYITDEMLDYVDIQVIFLGVEPGKEYGEKARIYNEDFAISSWFNKASIREQEYGLDGGSGYIITFALKDDLTYVLNVYNNYVRINEKNYYLVGGLPRFLREF